jgi:hypothetical protein
MRPHGVSTESPGRRTGEVIGSIRDLTALYFLAPLAVYLCTVAPSVGFADSAIAIELIQRLEFDSHVNNHNFTVAVGWLFMKLVPFGTPAFKANLASAVLAALAVGFLALAVREAARNKWTALITALTFSLSQSLWWSATVIENCAANAFFLALSIYALRRNHSKTAAFLAGLSIFNHVQLGFWCLGLSIALLGESLRRGRQGPRFLALHFGALLAGLVPWLSLVAMKAAASHSLAYALKDAFFGGFEGYMFKVPWGAALSDLARITFLQAPSPVLPFLLSGGYFYYRKNGITVESTATGLLLAGNTAFFAFYNTWDKFTFLLPSYLVLFLWSAEGLTFVAEQWLNRLGKRARYGVAALYLAPALALPPIIYTHLTTWGKEPGLNVFGDYRNLQAQHLYGQEDYLVNPLKRDFRDVDEFAELIFEKLPPHAILVDDDCRTAPNFMFYYQRLLRRRLDITVIMSSALDRPGWGSPPEAIYETLLKARHGVRPVFIVSIQFPHTRYLDLRRDGDGIAFVKFPLDDRRWIYQMTGPG